MKWRKIFAAVVWLLLFAVSATAQQATGAAKTKSSRGMPAGNDASSEMNQRGEQGMGFSQTATVHHFFLSPDGGVIQVEIKDPADRADRDMIRAHLSHIAQAFANGDFAIPMFVHDTLPPGVPEMKRLRGKIRYSFEPSARGGRVVISTTDKEAMAAIHRFLRFQIEEHKTGDPTEVR
jgi:hypothetical protein